MENVKFNAYMQSAYNRWERSSDTSLGDVYDNWSDSKDNALGYCRDLQNKYNGSRGRIVTHCIMQFTYGFIYMDEQNRKHFVFITKDHDRDCIIPEGM